jgi:hypothetical protein
MTSEGNRSRNRLNLALLILVVGLAALVYWLSTRDEAPQIETLATLDTSTVERIVIERRERPGILLEKRTSGWWLVAPIDIAASSFRVNSILELPQTQSRASYGAEELELARYGLEPPRASVTFGELRFDFGDINPVNRYRYVRIGDRVHLVSDLLFDTLNADVASYVGPRLLPEGTKITRLALPALTVTRSAEVGWDLAPAQPEASADDVQRLIDEWQRAEALWAKPYAATEPEGVIEVGLDDGRVLRFEIAETKPDLVLARPDLELQYTLEPSTASRLLELEPPPAPNPPPPQ